MKTEDAIKKEFQVKPSGHVDEAAIKAAVMNAENLTSLSLPLPVVDPLDLTLNSQVFGLQLTSITPKKGVPEAPDPGKYVSLLPFTVGVIDGVSDEKNVIINSRIAIPKSPGTVVGLKNAFFANEADARIVCRAITLDQMDRRTAQVKEFEDQIVIQNYEQHFLDEQFKADRY